MFAGIRHTVLLAIGFTLISLVMACGGSASEADIEATVEARVEEQRAEDAALEAKAQTLAKAMVEATPTVTLVPTVTPKLPAIPTTPQVPPTPILVPATPAACALTDGEIVQEGWSGKDTGSNYCNQCRCLNAGLACTRMACPPAPLPATLTPSAIATPAPAPTPTPTQAPPTATPTPLPTATPVPTYTIIKSQILDTDTTWSLADSPYRVEVNIKVNEGVTLTVEPGVEVWFVPKVWLEIFGTLRAIGTEMQPITFSGDKDWRGLRFKDASVDYGGDSGSIIQHSFLNGTSCYEKHPLIRIEKASPKISDNTFHCGELQPYTRTKAIFIEGWGNDLSLTNNVLLNQYIVGYGIGSSDGQLLIAGNTLGGAYIATETQPVVIRNNVFDMSTHKNMAVLEIGSSFGENPVLTVNDNIIDLSDSDSSLSGLWMSGEWSDISEVKNNRIIGGRYGMYFDFALVGPNIKSNIIESADAGIKINDGRHIRFTILRNTIKDTKIAFHFKNIYWVKRIAEDYSIQTEQGMIWKGPTISNTNFINVETAVLLEDFNSDLTIPISDSYWETTDLEAIGNLITDNADDYTLGTVLVVNPVSSLIDISAD